MEYLRKRKAGSSFLKRTLSQNGLQCKKPRMEELRLSETSINPASSSSSNSDLCQVPKPVMFSSKDYHFGDQAQKVTSEKVYKEAFNLFHNQLNFKHKLELNEIKMSKQEFEEKLFNSVKKHMPTIKKVYQENL